MEHLLTLWPLISPMLKGSHLFLFLDFDGTLARIEDKPGDVVLPASTRALLERLNRSEGCTVAVISGRSLRDVEQRVAVDGLIYGGDHGAHLDGPSFHFEASIPVSAEQTMEFIRNEMKAGLLDIRGTLVEDKEVGVSVHYRNIEACDRPRLFLKVHRILDPLLKKGEIRLKRGKKILEITPATWDKGKAVKLLLGWISRRHCRPGWIVPLYIGDDTTDEDAFAAIGNKGITAVVGPRTGSQARFFLEDIEDVRIFLEMVLKGLIRPRLS